MAHLPPNKRTGRRTLREKWRLPGRPVAVSRIGMSCLAVRWWIGGLSVLHLAMPGCGTSEPLVHESSVQTQLDGIGLQLQIQLLSNPGTNKLEFVETFHNRSDRPIGFAERNFQHQLFQIARVSTVDGTRKLVYCPEPEDITFGLDIDSGLQIVEDFGDRGSAHDGGVVIEPSETIRHPSSSFTILRAGLYRMESEWSVDIFDASDAPRYKVLGTCTLKSNVLEFEVANDAGLYKKYVNGELGED